MDRARVESKAIVDSTESFPPSWAAKTSSVRTGVAGPGVVSGVVVVDMRMLLEKVCRSGSGPGADSADCTFPATGSSREGQPALLCGGQPGVVARGAGAVVSTFFRPLFTRVGHHLTHPQHFGRATAPEPARNRALSPGPGRRSDAHWPALVVCSGLLRRRRLPHRRPSGEGRLAPRPRWIPTER